MEFRGTSLVTGAAGFMGSHVVEYLVSRGVRVRATGRPRKDTSFFDRLGVPFVPADLTRPDSLPALFEGDIDRVFHLGAICNFSTPFKKLYPTNVLGVRHLTELALKAGVECFVHVSSTSVYGPYKGRPFREDDPRRPADDYGRSKVEPFGIRVAIIQPAQVSTDFAARIHHLPPENSPYRERVERFIARDEDLIQSAPTPIDAARKIVAVIHARRVKRFYQLDAMSTFFLFLNKILPMRIRDRILVNHMDIKVKNRKGRGAQA